MFRLKRVGFFLLLFAIGLASPAFAQPFVHPGGLHSQADLARMKTKVAAGESPWIDGWNALIRDSKAQSDYRPLPPRHINMIDRGRAQRDASAAYLNGLRWAISGDKAHADCAVRILNAWSETVTEVPRGNDYPGLGGIGIGTFAIAAELLRSYPGWSASDQARFKHMLSDYFYPVCHDFLTRHNGRSDSAYWANWDTCNMRAVMAIGVFCDDRAKFDEAVEFFKNGRGTGSIRNAAPFRFEGGLVQWQESGRDYAHVMGGQGLLMELCQIAWNQGLDLFGYDNNRLLGAVEHAAQYTLWKGVPYTYYTNSDGANQFYISQNYHGRLDASHFELVYNHYVVRQGLKAPHVQLLAALRRPEPGEIDVLGYGTLTYTLDAAASPLQPAPPPTPREVTATPGLERVELKWSPSGAYSAHGYEVSRATAPGGPFTSLYSTTRWTTPSYVDTDVKPGTTYYYTVAALNNAGKSVPSASVRAVPAKGEALPPDSRRVSAAGTLYSGAAGNSFVVPASGRELDGSFAGQLLDGDFCITARLADWQGSVGMAGLTVREPGAGKLRAMAVTLGEVGGRLARFRTRADGKTTVQQGCDYTWLSVWFRIRRVGDEFTAYQSSDGIEWFQIGKSTVALPRTVLVGLVASTGVTPPGRKATDPAQGIFDHVSIERKPAAPPAAPVALAATALDGGVIRLDWKNTSSTSQSGVKIEASRDGAPFYEIADLAADASRFENTGIERPAALRYRVRAYNTGGYSAYSNVAPDAPAPQAK
ncbi:MAG: alginate lyase family protein [Verrucomicrobia bacterium]|nr:alginate lyase family protein [Verrucomicrobiota bacterium]